MEANLFGALGHDSQMMEALREKLKYEDSLGSNSSGGGGGGGAYKVSGLSGGASGVGGVPPTGDHSFIFSRASSTGSVHISSSASSAQNTDDEDSDQGGGVGGAEGANGGGASYRERRREAHTEAERKRREAIKKGYDELQAIVPKLQPSDTLGPTKVSKATILQRSIDYIQYLTQQKKKQEDELDSLRKEVKALQIIQANLVHMVKTSQTTPDTGESQVSDEVKFTVFQQVMDSLVETFDTNVGLELVPVPTFHPLDPCTYPCSAIPLHLGTFQQLMDSLFETFDTNVSVGSFAELSGTIFSWLEEYCRPHTLRELTKSVLRQASGIGG